MCRILVLTGNYGSGKTEIAINLASRQASAGHAVSLVDLDIVNPYFRSAEKRPLLEQRGIELIAPDQGAMNAETIALPALVQSVFDRRERRAIFDVGGDPVGARALGRYFPLFEREGYEMLYVINTRRPRAGRASDIVEMLRNVEGSSRLRVAALVHNTNLAGETLPEHILAGQEIIREVCERTGLAVRYTCVEKELSARMMGEDLLGEVLPLELVMRPVWLEAQ